MNQQQGIYDFVILGAGISGLYSTYLLSRTYPNAKILILEKYKTYGGRIFTFQNSHMTVNAGAGRFHNNQNHVWKLLDELNLLQKKIPINKSLGFARADGTTQVLYSNFEAPTNNSIFSFSNHIYDIANSELTNAGLDFIFGPHTIPNTALILQLIIASQKYSSSALQNMTFIQFAREILTLEQAQFIDDSFGYSDKLHRSNAYDTILLILNNQSPLNDFYTLKGGLGQINDKMMNIIKKNKNVSMKYLKEVLDIRVSDQNIISVFCKNRATPFLGKSCISTLPAQALLKIPYFHFLKQPILQYIVCTPMCRIFAKYKKRNNGQVWFHNIVKSTTNNNLRMILPVDYSTGIIMISYCDNKYAKFWKRLYDKYGSHKVHQQIIIYVRQSFGIDINHNELIDLQLFYWDCAVGHWGVGANSSSMSDSLTQIKDDVPLYICGEQFSSTGQQWMEGALETTHKVVSKITNKRL